MKSQKQELIKMLFYQHSEPVSPKFTFVCVILKLWPATISDLFLHTLNTNNLK
jgi:hypothetical protein